MLFLGFMNNRVTEAFHLQEFFHCVAVSCNLQDIGMQWKISCKKL